MGVWIALLSIFSLTASVVIAHLIQHKYFPTYVRCTLKHCMCSIKHKIRISSSALGMLMSQRCTMIRAYCDITVIFWNRSTGEASLSKTQSICSGGQHTEGVGGIMTPVLCYRFS